MRTMRLLIYLVFVTSLGFASSLLVNIVTGEEDTKKTAHNTEGNADLVPTTSDHNTTTNSHPTKSTDHASRTSDHAPTINAHAPTTDGHPSKSDAHNIKVMNQKNDAQMSCIVSESAIEDIKKSKEQLEIKQKEIAAKESEIKVKEEALKEELKKLEKIREEIDHLKTAKNKAEEQKVIKLTETVLTMSPRAASKMFTQLDEKLAVDVMLKMDNEKLAKVLSVMDPVYSSRLSEMMAGVTKKVKTNSVNQMKGGEQKNGRDISHVNEQQPRNESRKQPAFEPKQQAQQTQQTVGSAAAAEKGTKPN